MRNITANKTVLDGLMSTSGSNTYYAAHVVTGSGTNSTAVLDGFTIYQGYSSVSGSLGAGLYDVSGSPTINNCIFSHNTVQASGGAVYNSASSPTFTSCTFLENSAVNGGAIYNTNSSAPRFTNCTITHNQANTSGGGVYSDSTSAATFSGCNISWNTLLASSSSTSGGGAIYSSNSASKFSNCVFVHNSGGEFGGAVYCTGAASAAFVQCVFNGNLCTTSGSGTGGGGGGIYTTAGAAPTFTNCTFTANSIPPLFAHGAALYQNSSSSAAVVNCVFWGNTGPDATPIYIGAGSVNVTYSDVQGGASGTGNVNVDPVFTNAAGVNGVAGDDDDDLRLRPSSPVADVGNKNVSDLSGITTDLAGAPRFADIPTAPDTGAGTAPLVDMGAYEAQPGMVADAYGPYYVAAGGSISLNSYGYSDQTGSLSFAWDLDGDGQYDDATSPNPTFSAAGITGPTTITISPQITDSANHVKTALATLKVIPHVIYVDDSAPGANNGGSWTDAYRSLADAMNDALPGCEIRVAQGTYFATDGSNPWDSMMLKNGQLLLGGYAGYGAPNPDARNSNSNPTILSGDIGLSGDNGDNTIEILRAVNLDNTPVVDGFTFALGSGALYINFASPTVRNCSFVSNVNHAALYLQDSSSAISNCLFKLNGIGSLLGGAMQIQLTPLSPTTPPTITDCIFIGNTSGWGGAVYFFDWSGKHFSSNEATFDGCTFSGNALANLVPSPDGSAMYIDSKSGIGGTGLNIANSIFWRNYDLAGNTGGLPLHEGASVTITNCVGNVGTSADPLFVRNPNRGADSIWGTADDDLGDVHLQSTSRAIDAGLNSAVPSSTSLDFDGNPRFADTTGVHDPGVIVDIGPYETMASLAAKTASFQTPPTATSVQVTFNQNLDPSSIEGPDLLITNVGTNAIVDGAKFTTPSYNASTFAGVWTFNTPLPDGNYHATLAASSISDAADHSTNAASIGVDFFFLAGDANHDRFVNTADFTILAGNFNKTAAGLAGDFNLDGKVNALDFNALASNFGMHLAPASGMAIDSIAPRQFVGPAIFSQAPIPNNDDAFQADANFFKDVLNTL